jgi:hypothetical protein
LWLGRQRLSGGRMSLENVTRIQLAGTPHK